MALPLANTSWRAFLEEAGFVNTTLGFQMRRIAPIALACARANANSRGEHEDDELPGVSETA